jgi:DNA-binding XRE family transcriptional regulator
MTSVVRELAWPASWAISCTGMPEADTRLTKLVRNSRGAPVSSMPAARQVDRKDRRTLAASSAMPVAMVRTRACSCQSFPAASDAHGVQVDVIPAKRPGLFGADVDDTAGSPPHYAIRCQDNWTQVCCQEIRTSKRCLEIRTLLRCLQMETSHQTTRGDGPFRVYTPASLGAAIRHYREQAGISQAELAERAGLNRTYLSDLERGKETEQVKRIFRVLRQLGVRMTLDKADW